MVADTGRIFVETAILSLKICQSQPATRFESPDKCGNQCSDITNMVHGHAAEDQIEFSFKTVPHGQIY